MDQPNSTTPGDSPEPVQSPPVPNSAGPEQSSPTGGSPQPQPQAAPGIAPTPTIQPVVARADHGNRLRLKYVLPLSFLLIIMVVIAFFSFHKSPKPKATQTGRSAYATSPASTAQLDADNASRQNDAAALAAAVGNYIANNTGKLPQSTASLSKHAVEICGKTCIGDSANKAKLKYYDASAVSLRAYSNNLTVPDAASVYVVDNAACEGGKLGPKSEGDVAILFALQESPGIKQQCTQY